MTSISWEEWERRMIALEKQEAAMKATWKVGYSFRVHVWFHVTRFLLCRWGHW